MCHFHNARWPFPRDGQQIGACRVADYVDDDNDDDNDDSSEICPNKFLYR